ncbi:hypothetical protein JQS43_19740 [Natronosporangium hydrolyticum]|uniref:Uncharacterized protein n=1 Tax=Natronosporangium hydrolyticum TaxID=2811111 RepID=A0A895YI01_9ACTN|nr:hypothetical protein [Natronosporangium hydrolyticum]QSB13770.1 hypothetical protein JQS43_19740 [Natronosporangium hydrolyticum]
MVLRVVRAVLGAVLLMVGVPLLLIGGLMYVATQHQHPTGGYAAELATVSSGGYAVVVPDIDELLRRDAPFARAGQTSLRLAAETGDGAPTFIGLAPAHEVAAYLAGVRHTAVTEVHLGRGPLPVTTSGVTGDRAPASPPYQQPFWLASNTGGTLEWTPHELRGEQLALVVMALDVSAPLTVELAARVDPGWLTSTTYGLLVLGTLVTLLAVAVLSWPRRARQVVYVVPPSQLPEVAAHLGVPMPPEPAGVAVPAEPALEPALDPAGQPGPALEPAEFPEPAELAPAGAGRPESADSALEWPLATTSSQHVTATPMAMVAQEPAGSSHAVVLAPDRTLVP